MTPIKHHSHDDNHNTEITINDKKLLLSNHTPTTPIPAIRRHFQTTPLMSSFLDDDSSSIRTTSYGTSTTTTNATVSSPTTTENDHPTDQSNNRRRYQATPLMLSSNSILVDDNSIRTYGVTSVTTNTSENETETNDSDGIEHTNAATTETATSVVGIREEAEEYQTNHMPYTNKMDDSNSIITTGTTASHHHHQHPRRRLPPIPTKGNSATKLFAATPIELVETTSSMSSDHHHKIITECDTMLMNNISSSVDKQKHPIIDTTEVETPQSMTSLRYPWSRSMSEGLLLDSNHGTNNNYNNNSKSMNSSLLYRNSHMSNSMTNSIMDSSLLTTDTGLDMCHDASINSRNSRYSLHQTVKNRRQSLTYQESSFLEELIRTGNDIDLQIAYETLLDEDLFFDPTNGNNNNNNNNSTTINKERYCQHYNYNLDHSPSTHQHLAIKESSIISTEEKNNKDDRNNDGSNEDEEDLSIQNAITSISVSNFVVGSELRQSLLLERRSNYSVSAQMWKAHESGLAISHTSSRRSVMVREKMNGSGGSNNRSRRDLLANRRDSHYNNNNNSNNIFRTKPLNQSSFVRGSHAINRLEMDDVRSDNNRRRHSSFCVGSPRSGSTTGAETGTTATTGNNHRRASILRSSFAYTGRRGSGPLIEKPAPMSLSSSAPSSRFLRRLKSETNMVDNRLCSSLNSSKSVSFAHIPSPPPRIRTTSDEPKSIMSRGDNNNNKTSIHGNRTTPYHHHQPLTRDDSHGSFPSLHKSPELLSSTSSFASFHAANEISSIGGSTILSNDSRYHASSPRGQRYPSLHLAHVFSDSVSTIPPINVNDDTDSKNNNNNNNNYPREQRFPSLHLAHVLSDSVSAIDVISNTGNHNNNNDNEEEKKTTEHDEEHRLPCNNEDNNHTMKKSDIATFLHKQQQMIGGQYLYHNNNYMIQDAITTILDSQRLPSEENGVHVPGGTTAETTIPVTIVDDDNDDDEIIQRPVLVRRCTTQEQEEGIEVADWETERQNSPMGDDDGMLGSKSHRSSTLGGSSDIDGASSSEYYDIVGGYNNNNNNIADIRSWYLTNSFDDSIYCTGGVLTVDDASNNTKSIFRRVIRRTLSDESNLTGSVRFNYNPGRSILDDSTNTTLTGRSIRGGDYPSGGNLYEDGNPTGSWKMEEEDDFDDDSEGAYDAWKVIEDEYVNGYGGGGTLPFLILGTSADDTDAHPHVLSPPLMESLLSFVPMSLANDNLWMKYSLVRDGGSLYTLLQKARGSRYTFLAIETVDGEVFGSFTASQWRKNWNYFGTGESFLWRMKQSRKVKAHSIIDQAQMESEIEVYPYTGANYYIQLCTQDRLAVGGGDEDDDMAATTTPTTTPSSSEQSRSHYGFGLTIEDDCLHGTSAPCITFGSPSLSNIHSDGSQFEIMNLELWTLTPMTKLEEAEKLELSKLFLEKHSQ